MFIRYSALLLLAAIGLGAPARPAAAQSMAPVYDAANSHWYQAVRVAGAISWEDARAAAASLSYGGLPGHLVTVTSAAESQFVTVSVLSPAPNADRLWLGGYQDGSGADYLEPAGGWRWVTGEPWSYTNWYPGQPDNYGGNEDAIEFHQGPTWNDYPRSSGVNGYVVEYESTPISTGPLLSFTPNPVTGGQTATGQLLLAQPAGLGGVVVSLSSSNPAAAAVPLSLTVPTGANTFSFPVITFAVGATTAVTITAISAAGTATGTLQVAPASAPPSPPAGGSPVYNPANGHWYRFVRTPAQINWPDARSAAQSLAYAGYPGHLATITAADEAQFINNNITGKSGLESVWLGGYQDSAAPDYHEPDGGWRWVTGEPFQFTNWHPGEPNDSPHDSNALELAVIWGGQWDDRLGQQAFIAGYVVEFEPAPVVTPSPTPTTAGSAPVYNPANGHWYQVVMPTSALSWQQDREAAAALSYAGLPGHLATVTSLAENQFIWDNVIQHNPTGTDYLLGGYQDRSAPDYNEPAGGWRWVTGEPWSFTYWAPGEPNNTANVEDVLGYWSPQRDHWNDFNPAPRMVPFVVEYEPAPVVTPPPPSPAGSAQLVLFPNPTIGGQPALGQLVLPQPAGPGGLVATLSSGNPAAVAPAAVNIPAGASGATFIIITLPVSAPTPVTITAGCSFGSATGVLLLLPLTGSPPTPANLLVNGSFEQPVGGGFGVGGSGLTGWRILSGTVDVVPSLPSDWQPAPDGGRQSLDLVGSPGAATIQQTFPTQPGQQYVFSGWVSHNWGIPEGRANVSLNGAFFVQLYQNTPNSRENMHWTFFSYPFRATAATTTLTIADVTNLDSLRGTALDGLSVAPVTDSTPPVVNPAGGFAAPANLTATMGIEARVRLAWTDTNTTETGVTVWRKGGGSDWTKLAALPANSASFTDAGVSPGTLYTYRVQAASGTAASDFSNEARLTTPAAPAAPFGLTATAAGVGQISLAWSVNPSNSTAVEVYRKGGGGDWKLIAALAPGSTTYGDRDLTPGSGYTYRLRSANDYFASGWSNEASSLAAGQ